MEYQDIYQKTFTLEDELLQESQIFFYLLLERSKQVNRLLIIVTQAIVFWARALGEKYCMKDKIQKIIFYILISNCSLLREYL